MLFLVFSSFLVVNVAGITLAEFRASNPDTVDYSSLITCWMYGATKVEAVQNNPEMGYQCDLHLNTWTANDKQAKDLCESQFPYYVTKASPDVANQGTSCTIQINLKCDTAYWQINGKCYKTGQSRVSWAQAQKDCNVKLGSEAKVAQYYSSRLSLYFDQIDKIYDAWVSVPDMADYYDNGNGNAGVYVQDGAYKYDVKKGSIIMDDENSLHQIICEYTPEMTKAEMFYLAKVYSEIYPIEVYNGGALIPTANFRTIQQTEFKNNVPYFSPKHFDEACMSIGKILNVQSYPMTAIEDEFKEVKNYLTRHRFYLTNAYKNDGCYKAAYKQTSDDGKHLQVYQSGGSVTKDYCNAFSFTFNKNDRYPTMAGMRAPLLCTLHTFNWEFTDCPIGPPHYMKPILFIREDSRHFCHYVNDEKSFHLDDAIRDCEANGFGASLTGFDSKEEFLAVQTTIPKWSGHFWLGGESGCNHDCFKDDGTKYVASWNNGVGVNTKFLNEHSHEGFRWVEKAYRQYVSFRSDLASFHVHPIEDGPMKSICGKTAPLVRPRQKVGGVLVGK